MPIVVVSISVAEFYMIALARQNQTKRGAQTKHRASNHARYRE
jgi:hypothetical protein